MTRDEIMHLVNETAPRYQSWGIEAHFQNFADKFSKLIVKECVDVLERRFMGDLNREDLEVRRCIADVKKHFGVDQ